MITKEAVVHGCRNKGCYANIGKSDTLRQELFLIAKRDRKKALLKSENVFITLIKIDVC